MFRVPFTSGRHGYLVSSDNPRATGQAGVPMRAYAPLFKNTGFKQYLAVIVNFLSDLWSTVFTTMTSG